MITKKYIKDNFEKKITDPGYSHLLSPIPIDKKQEEHVKKFTIKISSLELAIFKDIFNKIS